MASLSQTHPSTTWTSLPTPPLTSICTVHPGTPFLITVRSAYKSLLIHLSTVSDIQEKIEAQSLVRIPGHNHPYHRDVQIDVKSELLYLNGRKLRTEIRFSIPAVVAGMQEADGEIITAGMMRRAFVPALVRGKGLRVECAVWDGVDEKGEERKGKDGNVEVDDIGDDIGNDIEGDDDESAGDAGDGDVSMQMDVCMSMDDGRDVVEHLEAQLKAALGEDSGEEMEDFGERLD